jgi:hypothetical protein
VAVLAACSAPSSVNGTDLQSKANAESNPGLIDRVSDAAGNALKGAAESEIPFRGPVRKLSGAERYSKVVAAAIAAGTTRRACRVRDMSLLQRLNASVQLARR